MRTRSRGRLRNQRHYSWLISGTSFRGDAAMWFAWACPGCVVAFGLLAASIPACFALYFHRRAARLADMRPSAVEELKPGPAKIKARVVAGEELLTSPMGGRSCVYYRFVVDEMQQMSGYSRSHHIGASSGWVIVVDDVEAIRVALEDDTGQVEVNLYEAEIVGKSAETTSSVLEDPPERLKSLLRNRYGKSTRGLLFNKTMSFTETILADGARVVVVGEVKEGRGGRLELRRGSVPLIVSDKGHKGLGAPYHRKAMYCWFGVAFLLVGTVVLSIMFGIVGSMLAQNASSAQQTTNPPPGPQSNNQPPPGQQPNGGQQPNPAQPANPKPPGNPAPPAGNVIPQLVADLQSPDVAKRKDAAEKLAAMPVDEAQRPVVKRGLEVVLLQPDPQTAPAALRALQKWGEQDDVPQLQLLFNQRDAPFHQQVIETLAKFPGPAAADTLAGGLSDPRDRPAVGDALREMGAVAEPSVLRRLAIPRDSDEKGDICFLLADIGTQTSVPALQRLARDPDPKVAVKAAAALNLLRDRPHDK
jgi:hypothetical protein